MGGKTPGSLWHVPVVRLRRRVVVPLCHVLRGGSQRLEPQPGGRRRPDAHQGHLGGAPGPLRR